METPYLDKEIEAEKAWAKAYGAKETENEKLTEFKAIKQALSLSVVSVCSCRDCQDRKLDKNYGWHCIHCGEFQYK